MAEQSPEERVVRALERARRPRGSEMDINQGTLANALKIVSTDLNTKPCHYQLELIQNADDNTYAPGVEPSLTFFFQDEPDNNSPAYLWVGCNEIGFDEASVRAISDIGGSTKKAKGPQKGYIGEKGLGFKSSFKIADKVWIKSGNYQFSLSREGLGMISPVWEQFKRTDMMDEQTMFCLRIPQKADQIHVKAEMLSLKPELLLFLRKLRTINVIVNDRRERVVYKFSVHRVDNTDDIQHGYTTTQLSRVDASPLQPTILDTLVVFRHTTQSMPEEAKRPGLKQTEVLIAFPTVFDGSSRMTFNFLPIRDFGLTFLLHADFITNINREDIIHHNKWNEALLTVAVDLVVKCIKDFNKARTTQMQNFKYTWPHFVKATHAASDTIMANFLPDLRKRLSKEPVLESRAEHLATPASLNILPERWANDGGNPPLPLFREQHHLASFVSTHYDHVDLASLSVKAQNPPYFAGLLKKMPPAQLHEKSLEWHAKLAQAMNETPVLVPKHLNDIKIIPLRDGTWATPANGEQAIYYPDADNKVDVPGGIEIRIVDPRAAMQPARNALFKRLMVQKLDNQQVCGLILERHKELDPARSELPSLSVDTMVEHARYLYRFRDVLNMTRLKVLKFAVDGGNGAAFAHELYMDSVEPNTFHMRSIFEQSEDCMFIHPSYFDKTTDISKEAWYLWLSSTGVSTMPELVRKHGDVYTLDPLFQHLMGLDNSMIWLALLRDGWPQYGHLIKLLPPNCVQHALVTCKDGTRKPLNKVYWATTDVLKEPLASSGGVDLLEVTDHKNPWKELDGPLGLKRKVDLDFYLTILRRVARGEVPGAFSDVLRLMHGISAHIKSNDKSYESIIRRAFQAEKLIAVCERDSLSWVALDKCMWEAPGSLLDITPLAKVYHEFEDLFTGTLGLESATAYDIAERLDLNADNIEKIENTRDLLISLSLLIPGQETLGGFPIEQLRRIAIFPVRRVDGRLALGTADDDTWFIADNRRQQSLFQGKVALLDFTIQEISQLMPLFTLLGITRRTLTGSVVDDMVIPGTRKFLAELSADLRSKAKYIALLVPAKTKTAVESKMATIEVFSSKRMRLRRFIRVGGRQIHGTSEAGKAVLLDKETPLQLHCRDSIVSLERIPWFFICETMAKTFQIPAMYLQVLTLICITPAGPLIEDILSINSLWDEAVSDIDDVDEEDEPEEDEPEKSNKDMHEERVDHNGYQNAVNVEDDDQSDDCLFVRQQQRSEASSEPDTPTMEGKGCDDPEPLQTPASARRSTRSTWAPPLIFFKSKATPSPSETRKANAAAREKKAINAIIVAAGEYDTNEVEVIGPPLGQGNHTSPLTGLSFGESKRLVDYADQNDRIRYLGELFVHSILINHFAGCSDEAWTSPMRTRQNLGKLELEDLEGSSAFTVIGSDATAVILEWLDERLKRENKDRADESPDTYHIFVKATDGECNEPFALSNEEAELAKEWTSSDCDGVLIFRVYNVKTQPRFVVLVDPIGLMAAGQATMTALGGGFSMSIICE